MKKIISLIFLLSFTSISLASDFQVIVSKEHNKYDIGSGEVTPPEPSDPPFWSMTGKDLADTYVTFTGTSSYTDGSCWKINLGGDPYMGDNRGYSNIKDGYVNNICGTDVNSGGGSEQIQDPNFKLPSSGKVYFEITLNSSKYANSIVFGNQTGGNAKLHVYFGYYSSYDQYEYTGMSGRSPLNWLKKSSGAFQAGDTYGVYVDIDNNNFLFLRQGQEDPSFYNSPIMNN